MGTVIPSGVGNRAGRPAPAQGGEGRAVPRAGLRGKGAAKDPRRATGPALVGRHLPHLCVSPFSVSPGASPRSPRVPVSLQHFGEEASGLFPQVTVHITRRL